MRSENDVKSHEFLAKSRGATTVLCALLSAALFSSCGGGSGGEPAVTLRPPVVPASPSTSPVTFSNITSQAGVNYRHVLNPNAPTDPERMCAGVASGDFDNDGYSDLYVVSGDNSVPNALYRNDGAGDLTFSKVAFSAGSRISTARGCGSSFADIDGDGFLDVFVTAVNGESVSLYRNLDGKDFEDKSDAAGLNALTRPHSFGASFGDYDLDGDLDLALGHWDWDETSPNTTAIADTETLWRNNGDFSFTNVSVESVLSLAIGADGTDYTFTPNFADIDGDRYPDLLFAADFATSQMFLNNGDGTFTDSTTSVISDQNGMGAAIGDYDNDGDLDWFVTAIAEHGVSEVGGFTGNRLYRNDGSGHFDDVTDEAGVRIGGWAWGSCFADFDNDGQLDIFHVNGWYDDRFDDSLSRLFMADGNGGFKNLTLESGLSTDRQGRGLVCTDFDRDGDIDIFIVNNDNFAELYRNDLSTGAHWLTVVLRDNSSLNTRGIGARVYLTADGTTQMREIRSGSNFVSHNPPDAHFGIADSTTVTQLRVVWPDATETVLSNIAPDQVLIVEE